MRPILLEARGVSAESGVLNQVDLTVRAGDFIAILGPPGSGKSTLLRILGFRTYPARGALFWHSRLVTPLTRPEQRELRQHGARLISGRPPRLLQAVELAVMRRPELLLIDHPAGVPLPLTLMQLLSSLNRRGQTILLATEYPDEALWCSTIYMLKDARLYPLSR